MGLDFEDDGASFRVRRRRQLDGLIQRTIVIDRRQPREEYKPPLIWKIVVYPLVYGFLAWLGLLAFCVLDFILWEMGFQV